MVFKRDLIRHKELYKSKKATIAINVIIIAAIALVVLMIMLFIITKYTKSTTTELDNCKSKGGNLGCVQESQCNSPGKINLGSMFCSQEGYVCCRELGK